MPAAPPVGITVADIRRADFVLIGHSHFDHLWGAERIARQTGAVVIGSHESVRLLNDKDRIPEEQLLAVAGGEPIDLAPGVRVRVFPSLHSCIWAKMGGTADEACLGDLGIANARLIAPGSAARSVVLARIDLTGANAMPPLSKHTIDTAGVQLITSWINGLTSCN